MGVPTSMWFGVYFNIYMACSDSCFTQFSPNIRFVVVNYPSKKIVTVFNSSLSTILLPISSTILLLISGLDTAYSQYLIKLCELLSSDNVTHGSPIYGAGVFKPEFDSFDSGSESKFLVP